MIPPAPPSHPPLPASPEDFTRAFVAAFVAQDAARIGALLVEDAQVLSMSGQWSEGPAEMEAIWAGEFAGQFAHARLVTGRTSLRRLGPGAAVLHQRFVVTGAQAAEGTELPRFPAMLSAVLVARHAGWQAVSLGFCALATG